MRFDFTTKMCISFAFVQDKILQSTGRGHSVTVTNDGATILKSLHVDNPAAKVLVGALSLGMLFFDPTELHCY